MIKSSEFLCPVCCTQTTRSQAFSIGKCTHLFCQNCCIQHIYARLSAFQSIRCLENNCQQKLTNQSKIYANLSTQSKKKFNKYQQFLTIQQNNNLKPCNTEQCFGLLDLSKKQQNMKNISALKCNICKTEHCIKCYSLAHKNQQKCKEMNEEDKRRQQKLMKNLNYRRCPSCSIWVQKNGGCQYLTCKCKTQFCFVCGSKFQNDPCRKNQMHEIQRQIHLLLNFSNTIKKPQNAFGYICFLPKGILKIILVLLITILSGIIFMSLVFGVLVPLIYFVAPAGLIVILGQFDLNVKLICFLRMLAVLLYPVVGLVAAIVVFLVFSTYPLMRIILNMQIYDEIDRFMHQMTSIYLRAIKCIFSF